MTESPLMKTPGQFFCLNCFYFRMTPTGQRVVKSVPFCNRRGRMIGWNPKLFVCSSYGSADVTVKAQSSLDWNWKR